MAAKGHLTGHGHGQRIALYIQVVLGGFKTYELSKAKSSLFCAVFALTFYSMSKEDWKFMHIRKSESCGDMLSHLPLTAVCCQRHLRFHPSPCVPKQSLQSMSKQFQAQPLTNWLKFFERKIDHMFGFSCYAGYSLSAFL